MTEWDRIRLGSYSYRFCKKRFQLLIGNMYSGVQKDVRVSLSLHDGESSPAYATMVFFKEGEWKGGESYGYEPIANVDFSEVLDRVRLGTTVCKAEVSYKREDGAEVQYTRVFGIKLIPPKEGAN